MSVTAPAGYVAAGVRCGIKADPGALDLALVATDDGTAVPAAAVFTSNRATAAPVEVSRAHLAVSGGRAAAVILNSGNANAATGERGREHAEQTCGAVAAKLACSPHDVLVCSTGLIGIPLPIDAVLGGVGPLVDSRGPDRAAAARAAEAIRTTDTVAKEVTVSAAGFTVGGMAKGAAMLAPHLATMLAVLTTDASVDAQDLQEVLTAAVDESFNQLSVDGAMSTNDTVVLLANGRAPRPDPMVFREAVTSACADLALLMATDAEGATKVVRVRVTGAASAEEARRAARQVADSQLVKCSLYGRDPYWGRVVSELGSAGVAFDPELVSVAYGGVAVCEGAVAVDHDRQAVAAHLAGREVLVSADLGLGPAEATVLSADLTPAYIAENMGTS